MSLSFKMQYSYYADDGAVSLPVICVMLIKQSWPLVGVFDFLTYSYLITFTNSWK